MINITKIIDPIRIKINIRINIVAVNIVAAVNIAAAKVAATINIMIEKGHVMIVETVEKIIRVLKNRSIKGEIKKNSI